LQRLAASGRTSFPVDKDVPRTFYRTIGYRVCGERAVRVDILERLADLIRPALTWRPSSPAPQPAGAFEGIGFTVTQAMTSLAGSSGEDFASILRALGYRMEKRPKPVTQEPITQEPVAMEPATAAGAEMPSTPETADQAAAGLDDVDVPIQNASEVAAASETVQQASDDSVSTEASATVAAAEEATPDAASPAADDVAAAAGASVAIAADAAADQAPAAPAEPELIEVWRPGGRSDERRSQRRPAQWQRGHQSHGDGAAKTEGATADGAAAAEEGAEAAAETDAPAERKGEKHRRPRGEFRRDRAEGGERRPREQRAEHRPEHQGDRQSDRQGDRRGDRPDRGRGDRPNLGKGRGDHKDRRDFAPHREREKQADPNSPFAKLAALKAQLEAAAKERR
jgi:ATP-dependent RNA helicase SUPV3L1/SUV3